MQARYYDPVIGRFYSNDPVDVLAFLNKGNVHGYGRYTYVNNNPYKYTDPDGEFAVNVGLGGFGALVGGILGGVAAFMDSGGDLGKTLKGAVTGFVTGATFGAAGAGTLLGKEVVKKIATGLVSGSGGDVAGQLVGNGGDLSDINGGQVAISGFTGAATSGLTSLTKGAGFTPKEVLTTGAVASWAMSPAKGKAEEATGGATEKMIEDVQIRDRFGRVSVPIEKQ